MTKEQVCEIQDALYHIVEALTKIKNTDQYHIMRAKQHIAVLEKLIEVQ